MVKYEFTRKDLFYAQYYRYFKMLSILIVLFGIFAIGVMVFSEAPLLIGILLFIAYAVMAFGVMFLLLLVLAMLQYHNAYRQVTYGYAIKGEQFLVYADNTEIFCHEFEKLETKVYRKLTYIYDGDQVVAFFPEAIRQQLLK